MNQEPHAPPIRALESDYKNQHRVSESSFSILRQAIREHAFPAASVAITHRGKLIGLEAFGSFTCDADSARASTETLFDVASLTKPVATATMAAILYERGLLELDAPVVRVLPEFLIDSCGEPDPRRHEVTFRLLLAHSSGLPAYEKLFLRARTREELLIGALTTPLTANPATRAEYSDVGFIVLGAALERIAEEPLDSFCQREIFGPLGMAHTTFRPPEEMRTQIPPTADERTGFRRRIIQGEVQDENASVLGGVSGHAGLFSTAEDLARFAHFMIQCGADTPVRDLPTEPTQSEFERNTVRKILRPETIRLFTQRESVPTGTFRTLGWDTPSPPSQSGQHFGPRSYGHLGYTGTSLWIDPDHELSITLLTNRTWPDCSNQAIKQIRPGFHDAVIEALTANP